MSGCVVLVMSSCHDKDTGGYDVLVYVKLSWQKKTKTKKKLTGYDVLVNVKVS